MDNVCKCSKPAFLTDDSYCFKCKLPSQKAIDKQDEYNDITKRMLAKLEINRRALKIEKREGEVSCSICPPNQGENKKQHKKHGTRRPRGKNRRA